jgi:nucleotide-binding universal stress UspA family protein
MPKGKALTPITGNTIVVAQDGSPAAQAAAGVAIQIAQSQNLSIRGLYIVDETLALDPYSNYRRELEGDRQPVSQAELLSWFEEQGDGALHLLEARCKAAGVPVTAELLAGGVPELVLRKSAEARLLALGRQGLGHKDDPQHLGRNLRIVAHRARRPVLIGGGELRTVHRLLLAYDGSNHAQRALAWAASLQRTLPAQVAVVVVQEDGRPSAEESLAVAQAQLADCQCLHRQGQPASEIVAAAEEARADLIVMGRYRHPSLIEWLLGSTVDRVLRGCQLPVLIA